MRCLLLRQQNGMKRHWGYCRRQSNVADTATVYNNSFEKPVIVLEKTLENEIKLYPQNPPDILSKWIQEKLEEIKKLS